MKVQQQTHTSNFRAGQMPMISTSGTKGRPDANSDLDHTHTMHRKIRSSPSPISRLLAGFVAISFDKKPPLAVNPHLRFLQSRLFTFSVYLTCVNSIVLLERISIRFQGVQSLYPRTWISDGSPWWSHLRVDDTLCLESTSRKTRRRSKHLRRRFRSQKPWECFSRRKKSCTPLKLLEQPRVVKAMISNRPNNEFFSFTIALLPVVSCSFRMHSRTAGYCLHHYSWS